MPVLATLPAVARQMVCLQWREARVSLDTKPHNEALGDGGVVTPHERHGSDLETPVLYCGWKLLLGLELTSPRIPQ